MADQNASAAFKEIVITPSEFDPQRLSFLPPERVEFKINDAPVQMTTSRAVYLDDEGNQCTLFFTGPEQSCFGPSYQYEMGKPEATENIKGMQLMYQATSLKTVASPTAEEQAFIDLLNQLWEAALEEGKSQLEVEPCQIPDASWNSFSAASTKAVRAKDPAGQRAAWSSALKPILEYPRDKSTKAIDRSKPMRMYAKLVTSGRGAKLRVATYFCPPDDAPPENPQKYVNQRGMILPCFELTGIYWGSHGPNKSWGANVQIKLVQANFTPISAGSSVPTRRLLPPNHAKAVAATEATEDDGDDDRDAFAAPPAATAANGDHANPRATLAAGGATAKPKAKAVVPKSSRPVTSAKARPKGKPAGAGTAKPKARVAAPVDEDVADWGVAGEEMEE